MMRLRIMRWVNFLKNSFFLKLFIFIWKIESVVFFLSLSVFIGVSICVDSFPLIISASATIIHKYSSCSITNARHHGAIISIVKFIWSSGFFYQFNWCYELNELESPEYQQSTSYKVSGKSSSWFFTYNRCTDLLMFDSFHFVVHLKFVSSGRIEQYAATKYITNSNQSQVGARISTQRSSHGAHSKLS